MADTMTPTVSGVQELIDQIRDEGINAVKQETEKMIREAKVQAAAIVEKAKAEAKETKDKTDRAIAAEKSAALEALQLASRETTLRLGKEIVKSFESHVRRLVSAKLKDEDILNEMILLIAKKTGKSIPEDQTIEILLSDGSFENDKSNERAKAFIMKVTRKMLEDGIEMKSVAGTNAGMKVQLKNEHLQIDLTEEAVTNLLLQHLLPRYRKVVRGQE